MRADRGAILLGTLGRAVRLVAQVVLPQPSPAPRRYLKRLAVTLPFLLGLLLLQCVHWLGLLLDEIFFRRYRRIRVRAPVFVLGVPRSGTTYLHRTLAADGRFTSLSTWECLFAPSIAERYLVRGIAAVDRRIGAPLARMVHWLEGAVLGGLDDIHPVRLSDPEEDYFVFMPLLYCFVLVVPFPQSPWLWRMARFDAAMPADERRALLDWYHHCLQKHLYVHGEQQRMLSKNAAFAGMAGSLAQHFEDSTLVICERDAEQVVGSQLNALRNGQRFFGIDPSDPRFRDRLLDGLQYYYENLDRVEDSLPAERSLRVAARDLAQRPHTAVRAVYARLGLELPQHLDAELQRAERQERTHRPVARPPLASWGLDEQLIRARFGAWCRREGRL